MSLPGAISSSFKLPGVPSVWAIKAPCPTKGSTGICSDYWIPAGAAVDTEQITIFLNPGAEGNCSGPMPVACSGGINTDLTDYPVSRTGVLNDSASYITQSIGGGTSGEFAYASNWQRVVNDQNIGIPNFFTWLDAYSPNPAIPVTVRQAFGGITTQSVSPYTAISAHDFYVVGNIYDSLETTNPLNSGQLLDWMTISSSQTPITNSQLTYPPPTGTVATYRFILRSDLFFQDGRKVTAFDVAFSYLSLKANGAFQAQGATDMTGITVLGPTQFDISVNSTSPFLKPNLTSLTILPGRYWTGAGSLSWDSQLATCTMTGAACYPSQFTLGPTLLIGPPQVNCALVCTFPPSFLNADPLKTTPVFDPVLNHDLVGSGPWSCGPITSNGSGLCSTSGTMNPPLGGGYTLTRFGAGIAPGSSISGDYFRSNGNLALWFWSGNNGDVTHDFLNFGIIAHCYGLPLTSTGPCVQFQQGMGAGMGGGPTMVGFIQISIVNRFVGVNWVSPFDWHSNPPTGIAPPPGSGPPPLILYAGTTVLDPASVIGCPGGYDC